METVIFNPPQKFYQLKTIESMEIDSNGNVLSVTSSGESAFFHNTMDVEDFFRDREADFHVSE